MIIDTDPGHDDAFAILLALASPELDVVGLTTVAGNVSRACATANARRLVELAGRPEVPVHAGAAGPLLRPAVDATDAHGASGMEGYDWPAPSRAAEQEPALHWMTQTLEAAAPRSVTLVAIGPQTNIAMLLQHAPGLAGRVRRIVFMGGVSSDGDCGSPSTEFNIRVDPEAAAIVLASGLETVAMPLDCTTTALTPNSWVADLEGLGTRVGRACAGMMRFLQENRSRQYGPRTRPLHDALATSYLLWPELFEGRSCHVRVDCSSPSTRGTTTVDWRQRAEASANCFWVRACRDPGELYRRMLENLARL
ncbi:MAG: nucleoside hydrolase [Acidisphaera sp.]|nr:nucleoside hydrolase [Acidisphaera sp.]